MKKSWIIYQRLKGHQYKVLAKIEAIDPTKTKAYREAKKHINANNLLGGYCLEKDFLILTEK